MLKNIGVFSHADMQKLAANKRIISYNNAFLETHINPASIDITIGENVGYEIPHTIKPRKGRSVHDLIKNLSPKKIRVGDVLYPGKSYVIKSSVDLDIPSGMYAYGNAKSTSGRNFLFVRILADFVDQYDAIDQPEGYTGGIWLLLEPLVYPIMLTDKECYTQLRIFDGDTRLEKHEILDFLEFKNLLSCTQKEMFPVKDGSVTMRIGLPQEGIAGYRAKPSADKPLDLTAREVDPRDYFEEVVAAKGGTLILQPMDHYLLSTKELITIPPHMCAEIRSLDERNGKFFSHYAGFFDPGFSGSCTLEVCAPYAHFMTDGDPVANFVFERMRTETTQYASISGNYQGQVGAKLPKQFKQF